LGESEIDQLECSCLFWLTSAIQCNHFCSSVLLLPRDCDETVAVVQLTINIPVSEHFQFLIDHVRRVSDSLAVRIDDFTKILLVSIRPKSVWLLILLHVHLTEVLVELAERVVEELIVGELRYHHRLLHRIKKLLTSVEEERRRPVLMVLMMLWRKWWAETISQLVQRVVLVILSSRLEYRSDGIEVGADHGRSDQSARLRRRKLFVGYQLRRLLSHFVVLHHLVRAAVRLEMVFHQLELVIVGKSGKSLVVLNLPDVVSRTCAGVPVIGYLRTS